MTSHIWLIAFSVISIFSIIILYLSLHTKDKNDNSRYRTPNSSIQDPVENSINPTPFKTGYIKNSPQSNANMCDSSKDICDSSNNIRYPITPPYVNYGPTDVKYNTKLNYEPRHNFCRCDNLIFNSSP